MQKHKYIGNFEFIDDGKGGKFKIELLGKINNCSVIKPRFSIQKDEFITWEKRYLPAVKTGILLITTPKGIMDHYQAEKQKTGGKLLGYVY
jgi:small subunit ribosomal protein S8